MTLALTENTKSNPLLPCYKQNQYYQPAWQKKGLCEYFLFAYGAKLITLYSCSLGFIPKSRVIYLYVLLILHFVVLLISLKGFPFYPTHIEPFVPSPQPSAVNTKNFSSFPPYQ